MQKLVVTERMSLDNIMIDDDTLEKMMVEGTARPNAKRSSPFETADWPPIHQDLNVPMHVSQQTCVYAIQFVFREISLYLKDLFEEQGLTYPVSEAELDTLSGRHTFRAREAEQVDVANKLFPVTDEQIGKWSFSIATTRSALHVISISMNCLYCRCHLNHESHIRGSTFIRMASDKVREGEKCHHPQSMALQSGPMSNRHHGHGSKAT